MGENDSSGALHREIQQAAAASGRWHARYVGRAYRRAVEAALVRLASPRPLVLKTDLWNECLGGERDVLGALARHGGAVTVGIDMSLGVCAAGRARVPAVSAAGADISALPFRAASLDAVLDLSTLDHLDPGGVARALAEYRRVLRPGGVLLVLFWSRTPAVSLRLRLKRVLGRREAEGQYYLDAAAVRDALAGMSVADEVVAGLVLVLPHRLTGALLGRLSDRTLDLVIAAVLRLERSRLLRPLLSRLAGLHGYVAVR